MTQDNCLAETGMSVYGLLILAGILLLIGIILFTGRRKLFGLMVALLIAGMSFALPMQVFASDSLLDDCDDTSSSVPGSTSGSNAQSLSLLSRFTGVSDLAVTDGYQFDVQIVTNSFIRVSDTRVSGDGKTIVVGDLVSGYVYRSSDGGLTWTPLYVLGHGLWSNVVVSGDGTKIFALDTNGAKIMYSSDSGSTWIDTAATSDQTAWSNFAVADNGTIVASSPLGEQYISTDGGVNWSTVGLPSGITSFGALTISANGTLVGVDGPTGAYTSTDGGSTWTDLANGAMRRVSIVATSADASTIVEGSSMGSSLTILTDSGASWSSYDTGLSGVARLRVGGSGQTITASDNASTLDLSTDNGANWSTVSPPSGLSYLMSYSSDASGIITAVGLEGVMVSRDGGASWTSADFNQKFSANYVDINPSLPGIQTAIDKTSTEGWSATYDPSTDNFVVTITNASLFLSVAPVTWEYTVDPSSGYTVSAPATIGIGIYRTISIG